MVSIFCTVRALTLIRESVIIHVHHKNSLEVAKKMKQWRRFQNWISPIASAVIPAGVQGGAVRGSIEHTGAATSEPAIYRDQSLSEVSDSSADSRTSNDGLNMGSVGGAGACAGRKRTSEGEVSESTKEVWIERCARIAKHPMDIEVQRRKLMLLLYLLRSPIFDRYIVIHTHECERQ